ncbi:branched-chain amino acid ABC transporter substrate-binding protein [Aquibium oceanicum]|uniref:Branched-chain amino acid ABC transporter substrate-binding protein n=1 Tax=Aquibium oceanicum TaxID=1670800 RepID=A0A1L3SMZ5_9HYPH|nr:branched-chain amino acid ABC transporter substrate-binding protein [Aquibium oceanicum]APH70764.1 branched-chain amino acid ABC transporter substrate-binding protein [Aquibium oceanicum]
MRKFVGSGALALVVLASTALSAMAQDTLKIGYVDPLSGGGAAAGQIGMNQLNYIAEAVNAKGGVLGKQVEIIPYDNKLDPQVSLVQIQKAVDQGVRIVIQGNGSSVAAAVSDFVTKFNSRNPGKEVVHINHAAIDPSLTNDKCSYWHFAFDANVNIKVEAMTNFMKANEAIKKVYLINQDYSFGHSVAEAAAAKLSGEGSSIEVVGKEFVPLQKVTDFSPYIAKIRASGADSVFTANWGNDLQLLIKAAGDAGLDINWYTFYAGLAGTPTAIKQAGLEDKVFQITEGVNNLDYMPMQEEVKAYMAKYPDAPIYYPRLFNAMGMVFDAIEEAGSDDPVKFVPKLEGMKYMNFIDGKEGFMRADDHQYFQTMYISGLGALGPNQPFEEENTGWGWKVAATIPVDDTIVSTTCEMERP